MAGSPSGSSGEITLLLRRIDGGDAGAHAELLSVLYGELRALAAHLLRSERQGHTLQPTALVHEAWLRLERAEPRPMSGRQHFMAVAARAMRQVLVDHARRRQADKRGGDVAIVALPDVEGQAGAAPPTLDVLALNEALEELERLDPRQCRVFEMRAYAGMTVEEAAAVLGTSPRTTAADWAMAKAWVARRMRGGSREP